jgi:hypothetical protein
MNFRTYKLDSNAKGDVCIVCLDCGVRSYHPTDVSERYCPICKQFHSMKSAIRLLEQHGRLELRSCRPR